MKCLQVFLPFLGGSLGSAAAARDMARAVRAWDGEERIWLLPELREPVRWCETWQGRKAWLRAVPAEELNSVDVYHVGQNGYVYGPPEFERFPERRVDGLLESWLTWVLEPSIRLQRLPTVSIDVPRFDADHVIYEHVELEPAPGPSTPTEQARLGNLLFRRPDHYAAPVSPESELTEYFADRFGALRRIVVDDREVWVSDRDADFRTLPATLWADPPLSAYFPTGVNLDALHHWAKMSAASKRAAQTPSDALRLATEHSAQYVTDGFSTRAHTWLMPNLAELRDIGPVIARGATLGLNDARTWAEVGQSREWKRAMTEQIPVRRAWGAIGLFWALLLERLAGNTPLQSCERCGKSLTGTRRKRFCSQIDNPSCFLQRRAADRRHERSQRA